MENKMSQVVVCDNCKEKFIITVDSLVSEKEFKDKDGNRVFLTYFDCPHCKQRYYVQADNQMSIVLKEECLDLFRNLAKLKLAKKKIPNKQQNKFKRIREKLASERLELMKRFNETYVTDTETGLEVFVKFSVL